MYRNRFSKAMVVLVGMLVAVAAKSSIDYAQLVELNQQVKDACPTRWEGHLARIEYQPGDSLWQGNLRDKAAFVTHASTHLKDDDGSFKLQNFNDEGAVILNCGNLKSQFFELINQDNIAVTNAFDLNSLLDTDSDGVNDALDICPDTTNTNIPPGQSYSVNAVGCTPWQADTDNDGVTDHLDQCPGTAAGVIAVGADGCRDSDGDGVSDQNDSYPHQSATQCTP